MATRFCEGRAADPWPEDYPDTRTGDILQRDEHTVQQQVDGLGQDPKNDAWRLKVTRQLVAQRAQSPDLPQIDLLRDRTGELIAVTRGDLLVRSSLETDDPSLWALLVRYADTVDRVPELEGRLVRLRTSLPPERLDVLARVVRGAGFEASVNHVTPLGPLIKGQGGPEQTDGTVAFPVQLAQEAQHEVTVAVVDTGIAKAERDDGWLAGLVADDGSNIDPLDAIPVDGRLDLGAGHGTFAAGVVQQVAPMARLAVLRAVMSDGIGDEVEVATAIVAAAGPAPGDGGKPDPTPLVINLSLGAETLDDQPLLAVEVALEILRERRPDSLAVAAAGNSGSTRPMFPAASRGVVAVAALDARFRLADWSNRGFWVDCSVVGEGVLSTFVPGFESLLADNTPEKWDPGHPWALWSGTSFAAPQIAGAVARRVAEVGGTTHEALRWLFEQAPRVPDVGHALRLLRGTPLP